jgi:hypothetical protein
VTATTRQNNRTIGLLLAVLLVPAVASCGNSKPKMVASGNYITTEHGYARYGDALAEAKAYCAKKDMAVRHLRTVEEYRSISYFECVAAK